MSTKKVKHLFFHALLATSITTFAHAGIYDGDIDLMRKHFGEYIAQSEKNIKALSRMATAYERVADAMEGVVKARHMLQGKCPTDTKENLLECLSRQNTAVLLLDLYARHGIEVMPDATKSVTEAGQILSQDVSAHLTKFKRIESDFKTWKDTTIPFLKKQFEKDRETLSKVYSTAFVAEYRSSTQIKAAQAEAAALAREIAHAGKPLYERGLSMLERHRFAHARFTLESMRWLEEKIPTLWKAIDVKVAKDPRVEALQRAATADFIRAREALEKQIAARNPGTERLAAREELKAKVASTKLAERDRLAFDNLFKSIDSLETGELSNKDILIDTLIERGFSWVEAVAK